MLGEVKKSNSKENCQKKTKINEEKIKITLEQNNNPHEMNELLFQSTSNLMLYLDRYGRIIKINKAGIDFSGFSEDEIIGRVFWKMPGVFTKRNIPKYLKVFKNTLKGKPTKHFLNELHEKNGKKHIMDFSTYPIISNDKVISILVVGNDITREKEKEERYSLISEHTSDLISLTTFSLKPVYTYVSPSNIEAFGYKEEELLGKNGFNFIHPDDKKKLLPLLKKYITMKTKKLLIGREDEIVERFEFRFRDKSGKYHDLQTTVNIIGDELLFVSKDITEHKKVDEQLKFATEDWKSTFDSISDMVSIQDTEFKIVKVNKAFAEAFDKEPKDLIGKHCYEIVHGTKKPVPECPHKKSLNDCEYHCEEIFESNLGIHLNVTTSPKFDKNGKICGTVHIAKDISERKITEERIIQSEKNFRSIFNIAPNLITSVNKEGIIVDCNSRIIDVLGYKKEEIVGKSMGFIIHPDYLNKAQKSLKEILETGELYNKEYKMMRKDKTLIDVKINSAGLQDNNGRYVRTVCIIDDITDMKKAEHEIKNTHNELKDLNKNLEKRVTERTAEVELLLKQKDEFIRQLSHDLKSPLAPFVSLLPVLKKYCTSDKEQELIDVLLRNTGYMKNLVSKTIQLAHLNSPSSKFTFSHLNLYEEVEKNIHQNKFILEDNEITIMNKISPDITIVADSLRFHELMNNLISNAVKYSEDSGIISIKANQDEKEVQISIIDNGIGIHIDEIPLIFNEFHKTDFSRHDFDSSGLGLPICKRIVEKHDGKIWVESKGLGKGSTFTFSLPKNKNHVEKK